MPFPNPIISRDQNDWPQQQNFLGGLTCAANLIPYGVSIYTPNQFTISADWQPNVSQWAIYGYNTNTGSNPVGTGHGGGVNGRFSDTPSGTFPGYGIEARCDAVGAAPQYGGAFMFMNAVGSFTNSQNFDGIWIRPEVYAANGSGSATGLNAGIRINPMIGGSRQRAIDAANEIFTSSDVNAATFICSSISAASAVAFSSSGTLVGINNFYQGFLTGTGYTLTGSAAAIVGGTTSPSVTLGATGTYLVIATVFANYVGATFAANQSATYVIARSNNTPAAISVSSSVQLRSGTTVTDNAGSITMMCYYATANNNDALTVFGQLSATPSAGSVVVQPGTAIIAHRIY